MERLRLFLAHVGKTGGTSLRHAAFAHFGKARCVTLYPLGRTGNVGGAAELFEAERARAGRAAAAEAVLELLARSGAAYFSTHYLDLFGNRLPPDKTVAFVRDPVDRTISQYNFWRQRGRDVGAFEDFIARDDLRDVQTRMLARIDLDAIAVLGVTDRHGEAVSLINRRLGLALQPKRSNRTGWRPWRVSRSRLAPALIRRIEETNPRDMALYARARARFDRDLASP